MVATSDGLASRRLPMLTCRKLQHSRDKAGSVGENKMFPLLNDLLAGEEASDVCVAGSR
jgi:hypothetical protein